MQMLKQPYAQVWLVKACGTEASGILAQFDNASDAKSPGEGTPALC